MERSLVKGKTLGGTMRETKRLKQYLERLRNTIESQLTCVPNVGSFNMRESVLALCVEKGGHDEKSCPSQSPPTKKRKEKSEKKKEVCTCCNSEGHRVQECPWDKTEPMEHEPTVSEFENIRPTICAHCRALDHLIEDCPALKSADESRRQIQCERNGKMGHDVTACLYETQLKKEKEMEEALKQKALERINKRIKDLKQPSNKMGKPTDKDTNSPPAHKKKTPSKRGTSRPLSGRERDESPEGPRQPTDRESGAPGGGAPDDPGGSDDGDDDDDEDEDLSDFLYDMRG